jgi:molybdate transport system substrate-binding protein
MLASTVLLMACSASAAGGPINAGDGGQSLTVFAGSSLTEAFRELGQAFEGQHPGSSVVYNFAGSQRLRFQLEQGARADVFASADWKQMRSLVKAGLVSGDPVNFASNQLLVIVPSSPEGGMPAPAVSRLEDLATPGVKLVLASPEVPAGAYSRTVLEKMSADARFEPGYSEKVLANLVSEETNVRNVVQKVALGEADAGMVYRSDTLVSEIVRRVEVIPIPVDYNVTANYPAAVMEEAREPGLAHDFLSFLQSETAQRILRRRGFGPADPLSADLLPADLLPGTSLDTGGRRDR